jgi:mannose-1-phosphate guanylyltransferase
MRALLLAAGFGTRLRPLTYNIPKCLVLIRGKPLLGIWLERLTEAGHGPFLVNTYYLPEQVEAYINNSKYCKLVELVREPVLRGTAGTLIDNLEFFKGEDGLLIHADNFCLAHLSEFERAHQYRPKECLMTMMTFRTESPSKCGIVELDSRGVVTGFHEKVTSPPGNLANGATYILSSEFLTRIKHEFYTATDFSNEVINNFIGKIYSYETNELFLDIGTPESYSKANSYF